MVSVLDPEPRLCESCGRLEFLPNLARQDCPSSRRLLCIRFEVWVGDVEGMALWLSHDLNGAEPLFQAIVIIAW